MDRDVLLAYPDCNREFKTHTDASELQVGAIISQNCKPIAFYSRKPTYDQIKYTVTEK